MLMQESVQPQFRLLFSRYLQFKEMYSEQNQQNNPYSQLPDTEGDTIIRTIPIPIKSLQAFYSHLNLPFEEKSIGRRPTGYLEYRKNIVDCQKIGIRTTYGAYSAESIMKLLRIAKEHPSQFMDIYGINTTITKNAQKDFVIDKVMREFCFVGFKDLIKELIRIRNEDSDKGVFADMLDFTTVLLGKANYLLNKFCETLVMVTGECIGFYLRRVKAEDSHNARGSEDDFGQLELVIGLDAINISFCSSNNFCENIVQGMIVALKDMCLTAGFSSESLDQICLQTVGMNPENQFKADSIPPCVKRLFESKQSATDAHVESVDLPQSFYCHLTLSFLNKFVQDIFSLIESAIVFLTNLVLEKKQLKNINYNQELISLHHPTKSDETIGETFMNLYCEHFEGLPPEFYRNQQKCIICGEKIIVDLGKSGERNRNIFQNLLTNNFVNPHTSDVIYYFKQKVFTIWSNAEFPQSKPIQVEPNKERERKISKQIETFSSYPHFCQFVKQFYHIRDRPDVLMILQNQRISFYSRLWGKKSKDNKCFRKDEMCMVPVRGKYCRHLQFYDLFRVYQQYLSLRSTSQSYFQCLLCMQPVQFTDLMYLHEMSLLIEVAQNNFFPGINTAQNVYLEIDHNEEAVTLVCEKEKGFMKKVYPLNVYQTLIDPLSKSQRSRLNGVEGANENLSQKQKKNKAEEETDEDRLEFNPEFEMYFYGS